MQKSSSVPVYSPSNMGEGIIRFGDYPIKGVITRSLGKKTLGFKWLNLLNLCYAIITTVSLLWWRTFLTGSDAWDTMKELRHSYEEADGSAHIFENRKSQLDKFKEISSSQCFLNPISTVADSNMPFNKEIMYRSPKTKSRNPATEQSSLESRNKRGRNFLDLSHNSSIIARKPKNRRESEDEEFAEEIAAAKMEIDQGASGTANSDKGKDSPTSEIWDEVDQLSINLSDSMRDLTQGQRSTPVGSKAESTEASLNDTVVEPPPHLAPLLAAAMQRQLIAELESEMTVESAVIMAPTPSQRQTLSPFEEQQSFIPFTDTEQSTSRGKISETKKRGDTLMGTNFRFVAFQGTPVARSLHYRTTTSAITGRKRPNESRMDYIQVKREREANYPIKMAIFSSEYHERADQLTQGDLKLISSYLELEMASYQRNEPQANQTLFSSDTRVQAGMMIVDCKDEYSAKWLKVAIDSMPTQAPDLLGRSITLRCLKVLAAKPFKTFLLISTNTMDSWDTTLSKMSNLGYATDGWVHLNTRMDRHVNHIFMDTGETYRKLSGSSRQQVHKSPMNAWTLTLKWLRGEDETGMQKMKLIAKICLTLFNFKAQAARMQSRCGRSKKTLSRTRSIMQRRLEKSLSTRRSHFTSSAATELNQRARKIKFSCSFSTTSVPIKILPCHSRTLLHNLSKSRLNYNNLAKLMIRLRNCENHSLYSYLNSNPFLEILNFVKTAETLRKGENTNEIKKKNKNGTKCLLISNFIGLFESNFDINIPKQHQHNLIKKEGARPKCRLK